MWVEEGTAISWDEFSVHIVCPTMRPLFVVFAFGLQEGGTMAQCEAILTDGPVSE